MNGRRRITRVQVARLLEVDEGFLVELEEHEIIDTPEGYDRAAIERARVCWTMHHVLGVNLPGLEVALHLLESWEDERRRVLELLRALRDDLSRE